MVERPGLLERLADGIRADLQRLAARLSALRPEPEGVALRAWRFEDEGGQVCVHLRRHADGSGVLLVNGTDALLLDAMRTEMARLALDDTPREAALVRLRTIYPDVPPRRLRAMHHETAAAMRRVRTPSDRCVVCDLPMPQPEPLSVRAQAPYKADLALHYACNNDCAHCYNEPGRRGMLALNTDGWRRVLDTLWRIGVPYVIFTGGEPTLRDDLPELVAHARGLGMLCGLNTNGRRLADPSLVDALQDAGLDHVQVTLLSHRAEVHDAMVRARAWEETVAGIRTALDAGLHTITNTTLTAENAGEAEATVDMLAEMGLSTIAMNGMIHAGRGADHPSALSIERLRHVITGVRDQAEERGLRLIWYTVTRHCELSPVAMGLGLRFCNAAEYSICVEPNGNVLPCQSYYEPAGNILHDPWESIWNSDLFTRIRLRRERPQGSGLPEQCRECEHLRLCGGGCPLEWRASESEVTGTCATAPMA